MLDSKVVHKCYWELSYAGLWKILLFQNHRQLCLCFSEHFSRHLPGFAFHSLRNKIQDVCAGDMAAKCDPLTAVPFVSHLELSVQISPCPSTNLHLCTVKYKAVQDGMFLSINVPYSSFYPILALFLLHNLQHLPQMWMAWTVSIWRIREQLLLCPVEGFGTKSQSQLKV